MLHKIANMAAKVKSAARMPAAGIAPKAADMASIVAFSAAMALLLWSVFAAIPLFVAGAVPQAFKSLSRRREASFRSVFIKALARASSISPGKSFASVLAKEMPMEVLSYSKLGHALKRYALTGNVQLLKDDAFASPASHAAQAGTLLAYAFDKGIDPAPLVYEFARRESENESFASKIAPQIANSNAMSLAGINLFFPSFAGITMNILNASWLSVGHSAGIAFAPMFAIFIAYVLLADSITLWKPGIGMVGLAASIAQWACIGAICMKVAYMLSSFAV